MAGIFQFLETHNLGKVLAEPHLLANSGEKAKFLSGGEIPIVIAQALNSTIVFKTFRHLQSSSSRPSSAATISS